MVDLFVDEVYSFVQAKMKCFNERKKGFGMRFGIQDLDITSKMKNACSSKNSTM